jgi:hypothetical protein
MLYLRRLGPGEKDQCDRSNAKQQEKSGDLLHGPSYNPAGLPVKMALCASKEIADCREEPYE